MGSATGGSYCYHHAKDKATTLYVDCSDQQAAREQMGVLDVIFDFFRKEFLQAHLLNVSVSSPNSHLQKSSVAAQGPSEQTLATQAAFTLPNAFAAFFPTRFSAWSLGKTKKPVVKRRCPVCSQHLASTRGFLVCKGHPSPLSSS